MVTRGIQVTRTRPLTDGTIRALRPAPGERIEVVDGTVPGLILRASATSKSFAFVYRPKGERQQRRITLGSYPILTLAGARQRAAKLKLQVWDGADPAGSRQAEKEALTVEGLVARYVDKYAKKKLRSWQDYDAALKRDLIPVLGKKKATAIERTDIADLLDKVAERSGVTANRLQAMTSSVFKWALDAGLVKTNPCTGLRKRHEETAKDRYLDDDEMRKFWTATAGASAPVRDVLRLILLTGQRPGECSGIRREEVDLERAVWTIPAERVKNKTEQVVPLTGEALSIVRRLAVDGPAKGPLIVTARGNEMGPQDLAQATKRLRDAVSAVPWTAHDLRRTAATTLGRLH